MTTLPTLPGDLGAWPRVPSVTFPGETVPSCPRCGSTSVSLRVLPGYGGRIGDPGSASETRCDACGFSVRSAAIYS